MSTDLALQKLIYERLVNDEAVAGLVGDRVHDNVPDCPAHDGDKIPLAYITFGPSDAVQAGGDCLMAMAHTQQIDIWSWHPAGFEECKRIGHAVRIALDGYGDDEDDIQLETGATTGIDVDSVRYLTDPDGITRHGIVTVSAIMEEQET